MSRARRRSIPPTLTLAGLGLAGASGAAWVWARRALAAVPVDFRHPLALLPPGPSTLRQLRIMRRAIAFTTPMAPGVARREHHIARTSAPGATRVYIYEPMVRSGRTGALVWIHGGGYVMGTAQQDHATASRLAADLGIVVVSVDYRLAPEHPFPAGLDDCYDALVWTAGHADSLDIDPTRIAVGGASAGGGMAAALAQLALDRGGPAVCFQALRYPMLDDRTASPADKARPDARVWGKAANVFAWNQYLGRPAGSDHAPAHAVPSRRENLAELAPAWIAVGDTDLFHDECVEYARRLRAAGVQCELVVVPGMYHGADVLRPHAGPVVDLVGSMTAALRHALVAADSHPARAAEVASPPGPASPYDLGLAGSPSAQG